MLIAALLVLGVSLAVVSLRYPDEEAGLTVEQANGINERYGSSGASFAQCTSAAPDPDRPCVAAHLHNFPARARLIGAAVVLAMILTSVAFRRRYDRAQAQSDALSAPGDSGREPQGILGPPGA